MNKVFLGRALGVALLRRPWASRVVIGWGLRRALSRGPARWTFLGGVGIGAGLMYLWTGRHGEPVPRPVKRRAPAARRPGTSAKPKSR
jgi:hypothetical protein